MGVLDVAVSTLVYHIDRQELLRELHQAATDERENSRFY